MNDGLSFSDKIEKILSATLNTIEYEIADNFQALKTKKFWIYLFAFSSLIAALFKKEIWVIIFIMSIIIIEFKSHYDSGDVTHYIREKKGIPNKSDIRRLKNG